MNYIPLPAEQRKHTVDKQQFIKHLKTTLPESSILSKPEQLKAYDCDALSVYQVQPWLVVLPETTAQAQAVVKLCYQHGVPIVARGGGTGLSGGALPIENGVLLSLAKFNRVLEIDENNRLARVQAGVRNLAVSEAAAPYSLYYAPDPSSQLACTIGGNIAENSGGVHCLKYGLTVNNVLAVKFLTVEGELIELGGDSLDSAGLDLLTVFIGSEGLLGIVVEATLKLLPVPETTSTLLAIFNSIEQAGAAVAAVISNGLIPSGLEMMDNVAIRAAEAYIQAGYPTDAAAMLLCELDGLTEQVIADTERAKQIFYQAGAAAVQQAQSEDERKKLWAARKATFPAVGRLSPDYYCLDGTIPRKHLAHVLGEISELSKEFGLAVANVFHAGDGNLHPLILYDANKHGDFAKAEALGRKLLELCIAVGGTVTGEHGVGIEKLNALCNQFPEPELKQFHALKAAFDEKGLLNTGKAIPSLHRCAEFGAMHVHQGKLLHSELERF